MSIFRNILGCRSLTIIGYMAEDAIPNAKDDKEKKALERISSTNSLDEAWAISHEMLGEVQKAQEIRLWMETRQARAQDFIEAI